jgi:anti-anti-sigma factor
MAIQKWSERIWVAQLADEPTLSEELDALLSQSSSAAAPPHLVLDLAQVRHINSSNLAAMLRLRKQSIERDVKLRLAGPTNAVWAVFLTTGLDKVFEFRQDTASALADLQMGG